MGLRVVQHGPEHVDSVVAFRSRMVAGGANPELLPTPTPPHSGVEALSYARFLILDEENQVRGGWLLQKQPVWVAGECRDVANLQGPISEGIVDRRFIAVAPWMFRYLAANQPLLFAVGMGGSESALARLLKSLGWRVQDTPFLFRIGNGARFLRNIGPVRNRPWMRTMAEVAAATRLSGLIHFAQWRPAQSPRLKPQPVTSWNGWADAIWSAVTETLSFAAVRNSATLDSIYPSDSRCSRFALGEHAWVVLQVTDMENSHYFGSMRVGTIVDILARPGWEHAAASAAAKLLIDFGVDLLLTNQMHPKWIEAFRSVGFWNGPSNYVFAESRRLAEINTHNSHLTRGDGDGRYHL